MARSFAPCCPSLVNIDYCTTFYTWTAHNKHSELRTSLTPCMCLPTYLPSSILNPNNVDVNPPNPINGNGQWCRRISSTLQQSKILQFSSDVGVGMNQVVYWIHSAPLFYSVGCNVLFFFRWCCHFSAIWYLIVPQYFRTPIKNKSPLSSGHQFPSHHQLQSKRNNFSPQATANGLVSSWCALVILLFFAIRYLIVSQSFRTVISP